MFVEIMSNVFFLSQHLNSVFKREVQKYNYKNYSNTEEPFKYKLAIYLAKNKNV